MTTRELLGRTAQTCSKAESLAKSSIGYCSFFFFAKRYEQYSPSESFCVLDKTDIKWQVAFPCSVRY